MMIWTDGEMYITHKAKCRCGFCRLQRSRDQGVMVKVGIWQSPKRVWKWIQKPD